MDRVCYNSMPDTQKHILVVRNLLSQVLHLIERRAIEHDASKLSLEEKTVYDEFTPKLFALTYGSSEYKACLQAMGPALQHHYKVNRHHPEHYQNGINDMSLLDLAEMLADWKAATERHADGSLARSLEINKVRFGMSDQLAEILVNTAKEMGWL